jgi:spore coat protein U-like protein
MQHGFARLCCTFISFLFFSSSAFAGTATATFAVTAGVNDTCGISAAPLAFGTFDPTGGLTQDGTTTLTVLCTSGTAYDVGLDAGAGPGATVDVRKMTDVASNTLNYSLYKSASRTTVWGNTVGSNTLAGTGTGVPQTLNVYGRILSGQDAAPVGAYIDTVTVNVNY